MNGWVICDKPVGWSSRKAGAICAKIFGATRFGHIGTLDPMASGLLPIALGNASKMIPFWVDNHKKEYLFDVEFGFETDTLDITGKITEQGGIIPTESDIKSSILKLIGKIEQVPPKYSAVHISGRRAYDLARRGVEFEIKPRIIDIFELDYLGVHNNVFSFRVLCGTGTYVRSIGRDIAKLCGTLGTVSMIRRIQTNGQVIKNAVKLDFLENLYNNGTDCKEYLQSSDYGLGDIPVYNLKGRDAEFYKSGGFIRVEGVHINGLTRVFCDEQFTGIGLIENGVLHPKRTIT